MMRRIALLLAGFGATVSLTPWPAEASDPKPTEASVAHTRWAVGDRWEIAVEVFTRNLNTGPVPLPKGVSTARPTAKRSSVAATFKLSISVAGEEVVDGDPCWQVDFMPAPDAPPEVRSCRLFVRKSDGWPKRVGRGGETLGDLFEQIGPHQVITGAPIGLPIELIPIASPVMVRPEGSPLALTFGKRAAADPEVLETRITQAGRHYVALNQVWRSGGTFWEEYERYYKAGVDLRAKRLSSFSPRPVPSAPAPTAGLSTDPRLRAPLSGTLEAPTVPAILDRLSQAAKVRLSCDMGADARKPAFASLAFHQTPVWVAMEQVAKCDLVRGRWEREGDGYVLLRQASVALEQPQQGESHPPTRSVRYAVGASVATLAIIGIGVYLWKRRRTALDVEPPPS